MTVKDLIKLLQAEDPKAKVIVLSDAEGNSSSGLYSVTAGFRNEHGDLYESDWSAEDCCMEEDEWEALRSSKKAKCVVLHPE